MHAMKSEHWQGDLEHVAGLTRATLTRAPEPHDAIDVARDALRFASVASAVEGKRTAMTRALQQGAVAGAAAFEIARWQQLDARGTVSMPVMTGGFEGQGGWESRAVPIGGAQVTLRDWLAAFACAALAADDSALGQLCAPDVLLAAQEPPQVIDSFWLPLCDAFAALGRGEAVDGYLADTETALAEADIVSREFVERCVRPLLALARAIAEESASAFDAALQDAVSAHRSYWTADAGRRDDYQGFMAWHVAGLAALGEARGLAIHVESPYLLRRAAAGAPPPLSVAFARRGLVRNDEARWFLDLAGFARDGRRHQIVDGGDLVARYDVAPSVLMPAARAEFVLPDDAPEAPQSTAAQDLALDAGLLMFLAAILAGAGAMRADLVEAVGCVNATLARLPAGRDRFTAEDFPSELGRGEFEREPGRFTRARLTAYRDSLAGEITPPPGANANPSGREQTNPGASPAISGTEQQRQGAMAFIELLKPQVTPLIEALCRARDPQALEAVRPRDADFARVFGDAQLIEAAREFYGACWSALPSPGALRPELSRLHVHLAPAGMLTSDNPLSFAFPGGYRTLAPRLNPHRVWVCWKFTRAAESGGGMSYDGLVWCDDHWAWFPKPYRLLSGAPAAAS